MVSSPNLDPAGDHALDFVRVPTPQLREMVRQQESKLPPSEFQALIANVRTAFDKYTEKLQSIPSLVDRAIILHLLMDRELGPTSKLPISCRQGCCACCHYEVEITADEAALLRELVRSGVDIDGIRLDRQAHRARKAPEWRQVMNPENRCVFLDESGSCKVYEHRPSICRKHMVTSPPEACATLGPGIAAVQVFLPEILLSAALSLEGATSGSLPSMLRSALAAP